MEDGEGKQNFERAEGGTKSAEEPFKKPKQLTPSSSPSRPVFGRPKKMAF